MSLKSNLGSGTLIRGICDLRCEQVDLTPHDWQQLIANHLCQLTFDFSSSSFFFFFQNKHLWYVVQLDAAIYGTEENILINSSRRFSFSLTVAMLKSQSACYLVHQRPAIWQPLLPNATHTLSVNYLSNFFTDKFHFKFPLWEQPSVWHVPLDVQLLLSLWAHPKLSVESRKPYLT